MPNCHVAIGSVGKAETGLQFASELLHLTHIPTP